VEFAQQPGTGSKFRNVVSILFINSINENEIVLLEQLLTEPDRSISGIDGVRTTSEGVDHEEKYFLAQMYSASPVVKSLGQIVGIQESLNLRMSHREIPPNEVALAALIAKETSMPS
jgi:hypothetical protein